MTVTDETPADLYYDPIDPEIDKRVHAVWKRLRDEAPLYWNEQYEFFALSRYDDVLEAVTDTDRFSSAYGTTIDMMGPDRLGMSMMIFMDPPEHGWHRKVVNRAFTPRTVAKLEERLVVLCNELLDRLDGRSTFDFVQDYGAIIPPTMILALVGFPEGFEDEWRQGVDNMLSVDRRLDAQELPDTEDPAAMLDAAQGAMSSSLFQILPGLIEERRKEPQDDLMSVLVNSDLDEDGTLRKLTDAEIFSFVLLISAAGTETVARLLGWVGSLLDEHPDQRAMLAADHELIPNAIEECLRYEAPSPVNGRVVMTDDVVFHGQAVPKGSKLLLLNGSANRDERHFENGEQFDILRTIDRHTSFGYGAHFCVGAALARIEGQVALREMLKRHPTWEVDRAGAKLIQTTTVRGYQQLPVRV